VPFGFVLHKMVEQAHRQPAGGWKENQQPNGFAVQDLGSVVKIEQITDEVDRFVESHRRHRRQDAHHHGQNQDKRFVREAEPPKKPRHDGAEPHGGSDQSFRHGRQQDTHACPGRNHFRTAGLKIAVLARRRRRGRRPSVHLGRHLAHWGWACGLAVVLPLAALLRLGWSLHYGPDLAAPQIWPDQREYLQAGQNLLAGRGLQFTDARFGQRLWAARTPGYPLLVAAAGGRVLAIRLLQALLDSMTVWAVYLLARTWLPPPPSLLAAAIAALDPLLIYFSGLVLSETLFTAMLAWAMVLLARRGKAKRWAGIALLALSVLVRPSAIFLPIGLAAVSGRKAFFSIAAAAALTLLVLFPWALRNHHRLHAWIWTATNAGITEYDGFNPAATGGSNQSFVAKMPILRQMGEVQRSRYLSGLAGQFILRHPWRCLKLAAAKIARLWSPLPWGRRFLHPLYIAVGLLFCLPLLLAALLGAIVSAGPMNRLLLTPVIYFTLVHAASVSSLRYRLPLEPLLAILAAAGIYWAKPSAWRLGHARSSDSI
jgi:Dolichyl-phosphate-mannose-protein mannosyltransferase